MRKLTLLITMLFLSLGMAWAADLKVSGNDGVHYFTITNGNEVKVGKNTVDSDVPGRFAFFAVDGVSNAYYIYSLDEAQWLDYTKAAGYSNTKNFVALSKTQGNYFHIEKCANNSNYYQIRPYNTNGVAGKYLNYFQGKDGVSKLGLWEQNGDADKGSRYLFNEVESVTDIDGFENGKVYTFVTKRGLMGAKDNFEYVISTAYSNGVSADISNANFHWTVYKSANNKYYLYNIGKGQFMAVESGNNNPVPFVAFPAGNAMTFKKSSNATYPIMFSTDNRGVVNHSTDRQYGLINWADGWNNLNDEGSNHAVVLVGELDDATLDAIAQIVAVYEKTPALDTAIETAESKAGWVGDAVGLYSYEGDYAAELDAAKDFRAAINQNTTVAEVEAKIEALETMVSSLSFNAPATGKYYRLKNAVSGNYMSAKNATDVVVITDGANAASTIFYLEEGNVFRSYTQNKYLDSNNKNLSGNKNNGLFAVAWNNNPTANVITYKNNGAWTYGAGTDGASIDRGLSDPNKAGYNWVIEEVTELPVAKIGTDYYYNLNEAANAVLKGQTITLLADYNGEAIKLPFGVILDKNGFTANVTEAPSFTGEGTDASPYIINNKEMLVALRDAVNGGETFEGKYFKLTSDIALNGEWTAIGNGSRNGTGYTGNAFKGVFDGDGKTISGLIISSTTGAKAAIGLFGVVDGGTVKNVNLTDVNVNVVSSDLAGAAIGMMLNGATAEGITVSGAVVGHDGVGGIVGRLIINGTIANCTNNASVTSNYGGIGGIVGKAYYDDASNTSIFATIEGCTNNGTITAPMYVGGIAGLARANVANCVNEGAIVGGTQTGGIIGQLMAAGTVSGNENKAKVSGKNHLGGIIGDYSQSSDYHYYNVTIANNINRGELAATEQCAAILGCNNIDGFTAMTATGNQSFYFTQGLELFGNPEDMVIDATNKFVVPVAQVGEQTFYTFAEAAAAAQAGDEIKLLANIEGGITVPANVTLNGNGFAISGGILAEGDITFAGVTKAADFDAKVTNTVVNIPAGASLQLTGSDRLVIGHGATFNITGQIAQNAAKTTDKASLTPSLVMPGASFTGAGVTFNVTNAYISAPSSYCSSSKSASGTFDFNITNSIFDTAGKLAFEEQSVNAKVDFALVNSVLTTGSHLVFGTASGEEGVVIDNSYVNKDASRQLENCGTMTIKNGSVVNGAVATSSNAKNPGTIIVENATYAVTGEFSGSDLGTGTIIIKKGATVSAGSITKANITVDAEGMVAGNEVNLTANLSNLAGTLSVINNDKLEAKIVDGKIVLAAKPVAKIGEQGYATLDEAFAAAAEGQTITLLDDATPALTSQRAITKAAVIDLGGKTMTLTEDDLYFGTTTFKNGTIVVDSSVKPSTAVFWMFANQTLTFDAVKVVATGVTGTYLIGLDGNNSDLNLLNGSEILVENTTALDLDIICVNASTGNDIKVENSKVNVTNLDGRVFFRGNYTVKDSEVNLAGITKAGFRIEAGQTLSIEGTSKVNIEGEPRDGGIHMTDLTATYTKAETATVNATVNEPKVAKVGENTYRTLAQAVAAVEDGGTITLIANETFTKNNRYDNGGWWDGLGYSGDKSFTIDLGGFTVSQDGSLNDYLFWFKNVGSKANTITIKNGTLDAGTTAYCALCTASSHENQLTINTEDLNIINNKSDGSTVKVRAGSILNVKEGTVITGKNSYLGIECSASTVNIYDGAKIYMNGTASYNGCLVGVGGNGVINVYGGYGKGVKGGFIAMTSGGTINVAGGEWIANTDGSVGNNSNLYVLTAQSNSQESGFAGGSYINVTGGSFRGGMDAWVLDASKPEEKAGLSISGGNFNANPTSYVAEDYIAVKNNDVWNVVKAAAKIGTTGYATLAEAVKAVKESETITILAGTHSEGTVKLPATLKNVTIKGAASVARSTEETILKDMTISAADGNSYSYIGLTFDGITFDNSRILLTGWRNGDEIIENLAVTNCTFKNLNDNTNSAPIHINKEANEPVNGFTFTNNVIDGATGGSKSGIYAQVTGEVKVENNIINNVSFRPYVIQVTTDDGIADNFTVKGNTFSGSAVGRAQGLGNNAEGTDAVTLVVSNNIFKGITESQQICYWNFNPEKTTADLSENYYDIDIVANPSKIYFNSPAADNFALRDMNVFPIYTALNENGTINTESAFTPKFYIATVGENSYETLADALAAATEGATVTLLSNTEESIAAINNVKLATAVAGGVTVKNTYSDWINMTNVAIGTGVTLEMKNVYYTNAGVNVIEGTLNATTLYNANNSKTTVQNGGKIATTGMILNRYHTAADAGIYVYGDGDASTVEVKCDDTIGTYSGTFYAKDAVVNGNMLWIDYLKGSTQEGDNYSQSKPVFENSTVNITKELRLYKDATLTLVGANVTAGTVQVRENATPTVNVDANSTVKATTVQNLAGATLDAVLGENNIVSFKAFVAKVGNNRYYTLEEAFKAATSDCTIEILSDVTVDYAWDARKTGAKFTVPVTINGNGKTIKFTASVNDNNYQAPFRFEADATVKNLIVDMSEVTDNRFRAISSKGNLTVDGCTFIGKDESLNCRAIIFGEGAGANVGNLAVAITNSKFINWKRGITDNENAQDVKTVTITGNTLTDAGVGVSAKETVTFTGNTVAGAYVNIKSYTAGNKLAVTATGNTLEANTDAAYNVIDAGGVVNAEGFNVVAKGGKIIGYTSTEGIWGEVWGNARESFVIKALDANGNVIGTSSLNNVGGIIDGDVTVSWNLKFDAASNTDEYWTMAWTTAPTINNMPAKVQLWVDGVKVSEGNVVLNGPDDLWPIAYAVTNESGVIKSCAQSLKDAVAAGNNVAILKAGTYALEVKDGLTITGAVDGVEFANIGAFGCNGANVTFNNVTFTYAENSTYKGLQHSGNLVYNNCTFNGQVFLYGQSETFNNCTFNTSDSNNYNVWTYGATNVAFNECTFNSAGKSVLIYSESASVTNNVTVTKSQFIATQAVEGKAAIEMDSSLSGAISLTIDGETTASGFADGNVSGNSLWNNKKGNNDVANNDITVKVGDTVVLAPIFEAQIGDAQYRFLQDAINAVQNGETITVLRDIATNVEIKEKDNVKVTIDGNGMKMTGTIKVVALSSDNDRRITIKNFKFEDTTSASVDFITSVETNHYPRLTVEGCTFTGSADATDVALRLKSSKNVEIKNCTGKGLHSFLQNTSGWNLTIEGVTVTDSKSAFALGTVQGVTIKGVNVDVQGYGIRMDAGYNNNAVLENNTVKAFIPVVVRKATVNSNVTFNGDENAYTATNEDGIWCAVGTSEYEANGAMPTAATGNVVVALNDAALDSKGIYGNALAGQGTAEAPYLINNIGELVLFRNSVNAGETKYNAEGVYVALAADIDLASVENWSPIGTFDYSFDGNFDGQGHVIKNLKITDNTAANGEAYLGFFGVTANNVIKNFVIENVTIASEGQIVAAAIAYPYYTTVSDITVRGDIAIKGGNYTAGVLAYTRLCQNASNLAVVGNEGSYIKGAQVVGGVIADIQMNKGNYSNFSAEGVTVSGTKNVGGISGIIATQTLNGATVKNVTLNSDNAGVGIVAGCLGGTSTISNVTYENVDGATALIGNTYNGTAIEAKIDNTYYATLDAALDAEGEATVELFVPVTVATGESRVIELNGKTVIGTDNATGSFALININPEAELTINGEGAIKLTATNNRGWSAYSSVISNQRGKLTVNGGTIEHLGGTDMAYAIDNLTNTGAQNAETVINGGTVKSTYRAIRQFLNSTSAQNVLTVNGGTIEGANKSIWMQGANANANPGALTVAAAAAIKGDVYLTSAAGTAEYPVVVAVAADALKDGAQVLTSNVPADFAVANVNGTWTKVAAAASLNGKGYATLRAAVEAAQNGETVELLANVTLAGGYTDATEGLRIEKEITLNGNGHTIDCGTFQKGIRVYNPSNAGDFNVNFNNVKVVNKVANGRCIDTRSGNINLKVNSSTLIATNGNSQPLTIGGNDPVHRVTLNGTTIDAGASGYAVISFVSTNVDINGASNSTISGFAAFYLKGDAKTTKLNLGQGVYTGTNNHAVESGLFGTIVLEGDNNVVQLMGTNATVKAVANNTAPQAAFLVRGANNTIKVTKESAKIITEGNAYEAIVDADNAATTKFIDMDVERKLVAEAKGRQFYSFEDAVRFAGNEGTIKIVNDFVLAEAWTIPAGMEYTLDLNGKTVSYTSAVAGEDMITNRGNLTITDSSDAKTGKLAYVNTDNTASNVTVSTISTEAGSTLVVDGGTIENKTVKADGSSIYSYAIDILTNGNLGDVNVTINGGTVYSDYMAIRQFNNGTACKNSLTINGGYIYGAKRAVQVHMDNNAAVTAIKGGKVEAGAEGYALCNFAATGNLEVTGGEFIGAVYSARENFISGGIYDAEVYAGYCAEGYMPNKNTNGTYGVVLVANAYASIDGVTYGSLKAAINAAKAGETITLLQDVKENVTISKNLTIDGAGKTITGMITTDGKSLKVTIKNVKFDGNNKTINYAMRADDDLNLVVENCSASNYLYGLLYANKSNDKIVVKNVTVEGCAEYGAYLVSFNNATFENFTVKGDTKYGIAVANAANRNVTLKNVTFENAETPLSINETGTGKVTFNFSGSNEMSKAEFYTSQYVKVVAAAQVGTKVCGSLQDAVVAANDGETVKVLADVNMTTANFVTQVDGYATLVNVAGKAVTIDLNGKKVTVNAADADLNGKAKGDMLMSVFHADPNGTLTLTDSSAEGTGTVELFANDATVYALIVSENANDKSNPGKIIVNGGNYIADKLADSMIFADINEVITVNGGNFHLDNVGEGPKGNGSPWIFNASGNNQMHINVNGGTYNDNVAKQHWTYEVKLGEGLTTTNNGDGTWTVVPAVATVGEESFGSIQEAIDAAPDGETVKLIADVALDTKKYTTQVDNLVVLFNVKGKAVTFDLNGKKIDVNASAANLGGKMLAGVFSADVEGDFTITDSSAEGTGAVNVTVNDAKVYSVFLSENAGDKTKSGKMTVNAGNFTTVGKVANAMIYADTDKVVTINGGTFICDGVSASENYPWFVNTLGNNEMQVTVNGGTFNIDINHQYRPFEVFVPENLAVKANGNGTWTIVPAQAYVTELLGEWVNEAGSREHNVGYATVAEAIAATNELGKTVTILAGDYTGNLNVNKGVTVKGEVDENGNNLVTFNGKLNITADGATVKNINVNNGGNSAAYVGAKDVVVDGCQVVGGNGFRSCYTSGTVTFKNSVITGATYGIHFDGSANGNIVIENCTITGWTSFASTIENVTISGTTFAEGNYNQLRLYQNATITECTFNEKMNIDFGKNGTTAAFNNCSVENGGNILDVIYIADIAEMGIEVTVDGVPVSVAAEVDGKYYLSLQAAIDAATEGQTVTIVSDIALTEGVTVAADDNIFIDLNGKTVSMETAEAAVAALIKNNGTLTIESSVDGGKLSFLATAPSAANAYASNTISNYGTLTINGGTVENLSTGGACYALDNYAGSTANINGGKLTAEKTAVRIFNWTNGEANAAELNVVGGEIISNDGYGININAGNAPYVALNISGGTITTNDTDYNLAVYVVNKNSAENFTANISGGTFNGNFALNGVTSTTMAKGNVSVSGGTFDGVICYGEPACQFITGGSYVTEFTEDYLVYGYQLKANAETALYDAEWTGRREVVTIVDNGQVLEFANENDITVGTLTYKRRFGTAKNQSFYVPFEVPMSKIKDDFNVYYISNMHAYDDNEDAVIDRMSLEAFKVPANAVLKPNYPYIICAKQAGTEMNIVLDEATLYEAEENSIKCSSVLMEFEIMGVYSHRVGPEYEGTYLISGGEWKSMLADTYLCAFRLGMTITETGDSPYRISEEAMRSIGIRIAGEQNEDGTTTIYDVNAENGEEMIFDLSGRRVLETEKGIYIKGGKKFIAQ